jgi:excisionase family DNA binding protein
MGPPVPRGRFSSFSHRTCNCYRCLSICIQKYCLFWHVVKEDNLLRFGRKTSYKKEVDIAIEQQPEWVSADYVRKMLDLGRSKVYEILAQEEEIETVQIGRSIRVNKASLERWLQTQRYPKWRENPYIEDKDR